MTARKAANLARKRHELAESAVRRAQEGAESPAGMAGVPGTEPEPDFAAAMAEEYRRLLDMLGDETLRRVAVWKMEGFTCKEIAAKLGCVPRTVERKLRA